MFTVLPFFGILNLFFIFYQSESDGPHYFPNAGVRYMFQVLNDDVTVFQMHFDHCTRGIFDYTKNEDNIAFIG